MTIALKANLIFPLLVTISVASGLMIGRVANVEHRVITTHIVNTDPPRVINHIEYRLPDDEITKPVDANAMCTGKVPVEVFDITEQKDDPSNKDSTEATSYVTVTMPGSKVLVFCHVPGAYSEELKMGAIVQLPNGAVDNAK